MNDENLARQEESVKKQEAMRRCKYTVKLTRLFSFEILLLISLVENGLHYPSLY